MELSGDYQQDVFQNRWNVDLKSRNNNCFYLDLAIMQYERALCLQRKLVLLRRDQYVSSDIFMTLEHTPVFTIGRLGSVKHLKISESRLKAENISLIRVERGGDITYHGPGQLIGYLIMNLNRSDLNVVQYVECLEEIMIRTVTEWGIKGGRKSLNRGVWVGDSKIGSVGIAVKRGIRYHGFALNVNTILKPFDWIDPCGLKDIGVTSMSYELSKSLPLKKVCESIKKYIQDIFNIKLITTELNTLLSSSDTYKS